MALEAVMWIKKARGRLLAAYERYFGTSLLGKTLLLTVSAALLVVTLSVWLTVEIAQRHVEAKSEARLRELIDSMSVMASIACFANDATLAEETAQAFVKNSEVQRVRISTKWRSLADAVRVGSGPIQNSQPTLVRPLYSPFENDEQIGEILVDPNWRELRAQVAETVRAVVLVLCLVVAAIVGVIALIVTYFVIRPVKSISDALHVVDAAAGDRLAIPPSHRRNELGRLTVDINELVGRLRNSLQKEHEVHLQQVVEEKTRLSAEVFEHTQEGITITDSQNRIIAVNAAFTQITGYAEEEVLGKNPRLLASGRHEVLFYKKMWRHLLENGPWKGELWNRCKNGEMKPKWISISTVTDAAGKILNFIAIFSDISERKEAEERIEFLAHHDPLTSLPNRVLTRDRFEQAMVSAVREKSKVAMFFVDLDHFKYVNDSFGHQAGDRLLLMAVERLRQHIRDADTISRQGGDEFLIILPNIRETQAVTRIAQSMLDALSAPFDIEGHTIGISASIGITLFPEDGEDFDSLLRNADAAMYAAKASGKNAYRFFTEALNVDVLDKLQLKAHLRSALENNEFQLHYQPQVDLASGRVIGVESLIRWNQPELGMVSPGRFIPLAEESGMINAIGEWVLEEVCRQGIAWEQAGLPPLVIAINVAAQQFNRGSIVDDVQRALAETGYPPERLELEFTESGLLDDVDQSIETIDRLKQLGVKLAIDDFGTGYSSLSYLKRFKVEKLKIDQSFVRELEHGSDDLAIVNAIIQLGKTLQLKVIAEGVETAEQADILAGLGCDEVQGYFFARPQPAPELPGWIKAWQQRESTKRAPS